MSGPQDELRLPPISVNGNKMQLSSITSDFKEMSPKTDKSVHHHHHVNSHEHKISGPHHHHHHKRAKSEEKEAAVMAQLVAQPVAQNATQPMAQSLALRATQLATPEGQAVGQPGTQSSQPAAQPASQFMSQPVTQSATQPATQLSAQPTQAPRSETFEKPKPPILTREPIDDVLQMFPRRHLGTILYNPTTMWDLLQFEHLALESHDLERLRQIRQDYLARLAQCHEERQYVPCIPPLGQTYINSLIEVKISYAHIKEFYDRWDNEEVQRARELWGGALGVYTDDLDILAVLCHCGLFENQFSLEFGHDTVVRPAVVHQDDDGVDLLHLSVTLLFLPALPRYLGFSQHGLNLRTWEGPPHDGLLIAVYSVKWESCDASMGDRRVSKMALREVVGDKAESLTVDGRGWLFERVRTR